MTISPIRGKAVANFLASEAAQANSARAAAVVVVHADGNVGTAWFDGSHESRHLLISGASTLVHRLISDARETAEARET